MTVLRCTTRLLKRLHKPASPPEPEPQSNPLGEWYADFEDRGLSAFVVLFNPATGIVVLVPGRFDAMNRLNEIAMTAFCALCMQHDFSGPEMSAELKGFAGGFAYAAARDHGLREVLKERVAACFDHIVQEGSLLAAATSAWEDPYRPPGPGGHPAADAHRPLDLLRQRFMPATNVLAFSPPLKPASPPVQPGPAKEDEAGAPAPKPARGSRPRLVTEQDEDTEAAPDPGSPAPSALSEMFPRTNALLEVLYQALEDRTSEDIVTIPKKTLLEPLQRATLEMMRLRNYEPFPFVWGGSEYMALPAEVVFENYVPLLKRLTIEAEEGDDEPEPDPELRADSAGKQAGAGGKKVGSAKKKPTKRKRR